MKTSHTPGPWEDCLESKGIIRSVNSKQPNAIESIVARTEIENPEERANARLIAAAPDLLEAAKLSLKMLEFNPGKDHPACDILRAAIKKAEGEGR